jgi:hypothetical protein
MRPGIIAGLFQPNAEVILQPITTQHPLSLGLNISALYLGWQDPHSELWLPIGKMTWNHDRSEYYFAYTYGMKQSIEVSLVQKGELYGELDRLYHQQISKGVNLYFKPRMPLSRPDDAKEELAYFGLSTESVNPILYISRSGGRRVGDSYDVFPEVKQDIDGKYHFHFIPLDLAGNPDRHEYINRLGIGTKLNCVDGYLYDRHRVQIAQAPGYISDLCKSHPDSMKIEVAKMALLVY